MEYTNRNAEYADLTLTIEINQNVWNDLNAKGYSDVDIQKELEKRLMYGIARIDCPLMFDVDEIKVRRFR